MSENGIKISGLTAATSVDNADVVPGVQSGTTKKFSFSTIKSWIQGWLTKTDVGLGNVDNVQQYSASNKPTPADIGAAADSTVAIVETGATASQNISAGQYVIWQGLLYTADANISSGTTLASSGGSKNLTAVIGGAANALKSAINAGGDIESGDFALTFTGGNYTTPFDNVTSKYYKTGRVVQLVGSFKLASGASASSSASYVTIALPFTNIAVYGSSTLGEAYISNNGEKLRCKASYAYFYIYLGSVFNGASVYAQAGQTIEFSLTYITSA